MLFHKRIPKKQQAMPKRLQDTQEDEYEICVACRAFTNIPKSWPPALRSDYLPGAGQLCHECAIENVNEERDAMRHGFVYPLPFYEKKG